MDLLCFYNIKNVPENIKYTDIYFSKEYGLLCEKSDYSIWELCKYKDLIFVYLKKQIFINNEKYYNLITPYGYSGISFEFTKTFDEFYKIFLDKCKEYKYNEIIIRQNPYINIKYPEYISDKIIKQKKIYGINTNDFDEYFKKNINCSTRNMYTKACKNKYSFLIELFNHENKQNFINMYHETMNFLNADKYYYFNDEYFNDLINLKDNIKLCKICNEDNIILGQVLILIYNNFVHYHLSCNDRSDNCITDFMILNIIKNFLGKTIILGGGINDNDNLSKFKKKFSTIEFDYKIYKILI